MPTTNKRYLKGNNRGYGAESLPNITGNIIARATNDKYTIVNGSGAFRTNTSGGNVGTVPYSAETVSTDSGVNFDASRSSSTYQDNAKVNPDHIYVNFVIKY